jgi:hypothetical protein
MSLLSPHPEEPAARSGGRRLEGRGRLHSSWPSFETPLAASRRQAPQDEVGVLASASLSMRAP